MKVSVDAVKFIKELYPRDNFDNESVNSYRLSLDKLPPIVLQKDTLVLVDGYHRLMAHRLENVNEIEADLLDIPDDMVLWEAIKRNSTHGKQLAKEEKRRLAQTLYRSKNGKANGELIKDIAQLLAVSESVLNNNWLSNIKKEEKEGRNQKILELYLQCKTFEEIEQELTVSHGTVHNAIESVKKSISVENDRPESFQLYNVWSFANRDARYGLDFEGAIPGQILENVLYYYTQPFDIIVDPMAGGGTTIDVCKAMYRRYRAYDKNPIRDDIQQHDLTNGFPKEVKGCDLIFLDPPYYNMIDGIQDFKDYKEFLVFERLLAKESYKNGKDGGIVAYLIQDMTQKDRLCLSGDAYNIFTDIGFTCIDHVSCPLSTQQFNAQQTEKAKDNKRLMGRNRDLYIFKKAVEAA